MTRGQLAWEWWADMRDRIAERPSVATLVARIAGTFMAGGFLVGCAATGNSGLTVFADPGKYQFSSCENLANQRKSWTSKEQELRLLMDKAEQSNGGAVVNVLAYQADYVAANEELRIIESATRAKNCDSWQSNAAVR
jgi:hypothetical protein